MDLVQGRNGESTFGHAGGFLAGRCDIGLKVKWVFWSRDRSLGKEQDRQPGVHWIVQNVACHIPELVSYLLFSAKEGRHDHVQQGRAKLSQPVPSPQPILSPCLCDRSGLSLLCFLFSLWWFLSWEHINLVQFLFSLQSLSHKWSIRMLMPHIFCEG